jgi:hypothetical protein
MEEGKRKKAVKTSQQIPLLPQQSSGDTDTTKNEKT